MKRVVLAGIVVAMVVTGCSDNERGSSEQLVGAWRSDVQFVEGAFAAVKDLEFLMVFHSGGTMNESSNYDSMPPVPPAYGTWKQTGERKYRATYMYYSTSPPKDFKSVSDGGGWSPSGYGVLVEDIEVSADGQTFESTMEMQMYDAKDETVGKPEKATGRGRRLSR